MTEGLSSQGLRRTLAGGLCYAFGPPLLSALGVPVIAYVIRHLGPQAYGEWTTATSLVAMVTILANLGLRGAFVRAVARDPASAAEATADQLGLRLGLCLVACSVALLACLALGYSATVLQCTAIAGAGLFLLTVATTLSDLLQALHRLHVVAAIGFISGAALTAASGVVAWRGGGPVLLSVAYLVGPFLSVLLTVAAVWRDHFPVRVSMNARRARALLGGSRHFTALQIVGAVSANATSVLLPALVGPVNFGFFAAGSLLASRLSAIPDGLATAFYPVLARSYARSPGEAGRDVLRVILVSSGTCLPMAAGVAAISSPVARWLFPSDPVLCGRVMLITIWSLPLAAVAAVMGYALNAAGKDAAHARLSFIVAAVNLLLTVVLVLRWGLIGAAWALPLRYVVLIALFAPCFLENVLSPWLQGRLRAAAST